MGVREQTVLLVVSQYLGALRAGAAVVAAQSRVDLAQALYDLASDLQKNGVGTGLDTLRANVELQNEKQRLIEAQTQEEVASSGWSGSSTLTRTRKWSWRTNPASSRRRNSRRARAWNRLSRLGRR